VELAQPATKKNLDLLASLSSGQEKEKLSNLLSSFADVQTRQLSILDILEMHLKCDISFAAYLSMLPAMRIRQYSISSSPLWKPDHVTLTVNVLDATPLSGRPGKFLGVGSNYLSRLQAGDLVQVSVRASNTAFHLPEDPSVPIIMFAAGSGMAPMRGFIQERALQAAAGRSVGEALLFFGCRNPEEDFLYSDSELAEWKKAGVVTVLPAFSRASEQSEGCKYVQE
jgi:cytochrome P450/NADPH-cytochrome P450 reductase